MLCPQGRHPASLRRKRRRLAGNIRYPVDAPLNGNSPEAVALKAGNASNESVARCFFLPASAGARGGPGACGRARPYLTTEEFSNTLEKPRR